MEEAEVARLFGDAPRLALADIIAHPQFEAARKVYLDRFLDVYGHDPFLVRLLVDTRRFFVYTIAAVLEAGHNPARRDTWFTVGRLKQKMALLELASGREVDHLVARLRAVGFLETRPAAGDRRARILNCTDKLRAHDREWLAAHFAPLTVLYPQHGYELVMNRDPAFHMVFRRTCEAFLPLGLKLLVSVPEMMLFFEHAAGHVVLAALLQAAMAEPDHSHAAVLYADLGGQFGVSRTHVRRLLIAAENAGLVGLTRHGGQRVEILPRMWSSYDRAIARGMFLHDMLYVAASQRAAAA